jgi:aminoglycoside 2'-N-acetyltransferase I
MKRLASAIRDFELGALSTGSHGFYERLGWQRWSGPLAMRTESGLVPTPSDELMVLVLPHTPTLDLSQPMTAEWREGELW